MIGRGRGVLFRVLSSRALRPSDLDLKYLRINFCTVWCLPPAVNKLKHHPHLCRSVDENHILTGCGDRPFDTTTLPHSTDLSTPSPIGPLNCGSSPSIRLLLLEYLYSFFHAHFGSGSGPFIPTGIHMASGLVSSTFFCAASLASRPSHRLVPPCSASPPRHWPTRSSHRLIPSCSASPRSRWPTGDAESG